MRNIFLVLILIHTTAWADLDNAEQKGLRDTQEMLKSRGSREDAIKGDAKALDVDKKVDALTGGGQNKEEIYGIASDVLAKVAEEANGDPAKMQKLLLEAQTNPEKFYSKYFGAEQKARVKKLANDIEKKGASSSPKK